MEPISIVFNEKHFLDLNDMEKEEILREAKMSPKSMDLYLLIFIQDNTMKKDEIISQLIKTLSEANFGMNTYIKQLKEKTNKHETYEYSNRIYGHYYILEYTSLNPLLEYLKPLSLN